MSSNYEGDKTKNGGLTGNEIDGNFYFLRGQDIKNIVFDEISGVLTIQRIDNSSIQTTLYKETFTTIDENLNNYQFKFENGIITVIYPNGKETKMEGFLIEGHEFTLYTNDTLKGDGLNIYNPVRLADEYKTGKFAPANEYRDLTNGDELPLKKYTEKGYRIVTKENSDALGRLYPFSAVQEIQRKLEESNSQWRIPTKEDWDLLLNAKEQNEIDKNHNASEDGSYGKLAGDALKSPVLWKLSLTDGDGSDNDFSALPTGIGKENKLNGFKQKCGFWINENTPIAKVFTYDTSQVYQVSGDEIKNCLLSIRLIKEHDTKYNNYNPIETILGLPYSTTIIDYCDKTYIWTDINFYSDDFGGIYYTEWEDSIDSHRKHKIVYFVNEWDGYKWNKKRLENGDSINILDKDNKVSHDWTIVNNEIKDIYGDISINISNTLAQNIKDTKKYAENYTNTEIAKLSEVYDAKGSAFSACTSAINFTIEHVEKELEPYAKQTDVAELIVDLEGGNINLMGYATLEDLDETKNSLSLDIKNAKENAINTSSKYTDSQINELSLEINETNKKIDSFIDNDSGETARSIAKDEATAAINLLVSGTSTAFDTLREVEEWINSHSGTAEKMIENINDLYSISAETRLKKIENEIIEIDRKLTKLDNNLNEFKDEISKKITADNIQEIIKDSLIGTDHEIQINKIQIENNNNKLQIGFADDAVFGYFSND